MSKSIQALREQRTSKVKEARNILDTKTGPAWTDSVKAEVDALYSDIERLDEQIERHEKALQIEDDLDHRAEIRAGASGRSTDEESHNIQQEKAVFNAWIRGGVDALTDDQRRIVTARRDAAASIYGAQSTTNGEQGGFLVPRDFAGVLLERLKAFGGMREVSTVISTSGGNMIDWPTTDETAEEGEIVGENQSASDSDVKFGTRSIGAQKFSSKVITVPFELLQDARVDLEGFLIRALSNRVARVTNRMFTNGDGVNKPRGIVVASSEGKVAVTGQTDAITYEDLVDMEHSIDPAYRSNGARWMFHDLTLKSLKKLKDGMGRPLWRPGLTGGDPADILNYGYTINQHMDLMEAGKKPILFGDFKKYLIRDVMDVQLYRFTDSVYTRKGQVGFMTWSRHGGDFIDASDDAVKHFMTAES